MGLEEGPFVPLFSGKEKYAYKNTNKKLGSWQVFFIDFISGYSKFISAAFFFSYLFISFVHSHLHVYFQFSYFLDNLSSWIPYYLVERACCFIFWSPFSLSLSYQISFPFSLPSLPSPSPCQLCLPHLFIQTFLVSIASLFHSFHLSPHSLPLLSLSLANKTVRWLKIKSEVTTRDATTLLSVD